MRGAVSKLPYLFALLPLGWARIGAAHEAEEAVSPPAEQEPDAPLEVLVEGDTPGGDTASRVRLGRKELDLLPRARPGDILEAVPGVFSVQHAGGGKANQYFVRGFDADHGTDVLLTVDGVPVNAVSHGHGQGYADMNFVIPELVVGLEGYKGATFAHLGNFATAAAIELRLAEAFPENYAQYGLGMFGMHRGLAVVSPGLGPDWHAVVAADVHAQDGPFEREEDQIRLNLFGRLTHHFSPKTKGSLTWMSYAADWYGSGQIPARAVCGEGEEGLAPPSAYGARCLDRFGSVDDAEGGATQRHMGRVALEHRFEDTEVRAMVYALAYRYELYSNFTFFANDPVRGDGILQTDDRLQTGADVSASHRFTLGASSFALRGGVQVRYDAIENGLSNQTARERLEPRVAADIDESAIGVYAEADARLTRWLRWVLGARVDRMDVAVIDRLEDTTDVGTRTSGSAGALLFSPKASVVVSPLQEWSLFAGAGHGFHSNDARGAVRGTDAADLMSVARTYEAGTRVEPVEGLALSAAGFLIDLESETVWVGDEGTTEPSGATRRVGLEAQVRFDYDDWFFVDVAGTLSSARFVNEAPGNDAVALAPTHTLVAGLGLRPKVGDFTPFGGASFRGMLDRPATEDGSLTADGFATVDLEAGLRWRFLEGAVDVQNLFDVDYREVNFATESRLAYEPAPVTGIHYTPGWPLTVMGRVRAYF